MEMIFVEIIYLAIDDNPTKTNWQGGGGENIIVIVFFIKTLKFNIL